MVVQWARWRDRVSLDIFLVFGSLAILLILERALRLTHIQAAWIRPLGISVLLAHPYLLLRVVSHFRPVSRTVQRAAIAGLVVSLIVTWTAAWPFRSAALVVFRVSVFRLAARLRGLGVSAGRARRRRRDALAHAARGARRAAARDRLRARGAHRRPPGLAGGDGCAHSAGRARRGRQLLLRVRAAGVDSAHVAVVRALRISLRSCARRRIPRGTTC